MAGSQVGVQRLSLSGQEPHGTPIGSSKAGVEHVLPAASSNACFNTFGQRRYVMLPFNFFLKEKQSSLMHVILATGFPGRGPCCSNREPMGERETGPTRAQVRHPVVLRAPTLELGDL